MNKKNKSVKNPARQVVSAWTTAVNVSGWTFQTQASVLEHFITQTAKKHPEIVEEFKAYLRELWEEEEQDAEERS